MEYANAVSQLADFQEAVEEAVNQGNTPNNITNLWGQEQYVNWDELNVIKDHLSGAYSDVFLIKYGMNFGIWKESRR